MGDTSLWEVVGGVAAALAIAAAVFGGVRWLVRSSRRRDFLKRLREEVRHIHALDDLLFRTTTDMDRMFSEGIQWRGWAIFQDDLGRHLESLQQIAADTGDAVARIRALNADGADERLRSDVEVLAEGLRRVTPLYIWGIVQSYRAAFTSSVSEQEGDADNGVDVEELSEDAQADKEDHWQDDNEDEEGDEDEEYDIPVTMVRIPPSATGRGPTRTLRVEDRARVRDLRLDLRIIFRTVTTRLGMTDLRDAPFASWPIDMAESYVGEAEHRRRVTIPYET